MKSILIASKSINAFNKIKTSFHEKFEIDKATDNETALSMTDRKKYDLIFIDVEFLRKSNNKDEHRESILRFWECSPESHIISMASKDNIREAVQSLREGASDYLTVPVVPREVTYNLLNIYDDLFRKTELEHFQNDFWRSEYQSIIQTESPRMNEVYEKIRSVAPTDSTVLLIGETGTGKGVLARLIHQHSARKNNPFIDVHCGAIPDTLLESELFGHEKGSFTGAHKKKLGKFEAAHKGTIFLDEIATLTPAAQIKLLKVLQDTHFQRVGGEATIEVDIRVVVATNSDLLKMCENGTFRNDLYYRLNIFPVKVPALRERAEDISHFAGLFLERLVKTGLKDIQAIDPSVVESLENYPWPGNIRELENVIERAYVLCNSHMLTAKNFPVEIAGTSDDVNSPAVDSSLTLKETKSKAVKSAEKKYITNLLREHKGKLKLVAEAAGITTRYLHGLMAKHSIDKKNFKPTGDR